MARAKLRGTVGFEPDRGEQVNRKASLRLGRPSPAGSSSGHMGSCPALREGQP